MPDLLPTLPSVTTLAPRRPAAQSARELSDAALDELFAMPRSFRGWMEAGGLVLAAMGVPTLWAVLLVAG